MDNVMTLSKPKEIKEWRGIVNVEDAIDLIDYGILLKWNEMRTLKKNFSDADQERIVRHFAYRLCERREMHLSAEIIVESLLIWLASSNNEQLIGSFLEEFFQQPGFEDACLTLVRIVLSIELSENSHVEDIFSMGVAMICELGRSIKSVKEAYPGVLKNPDQLIEQISAYLLSVSNQSNNCIRLSLLQYFGVIEKGTNRENFNRIVSRFGHSLLEHLFLLLFDKRTEAVALQYLLENLGAWLEGDNHCQKILFDTMKFYMLKKPERFSLFVNTTAEYALSKEWTGNERSQQTLLQHLCFLFEVASEVNHRGLAFEVVCAMMNFKDKPYFEAVTNSTADSPVVKKIFREFLNTYLGEQNNASSKLVNISSFRTTKRGRRPSFAKLENFGPIKQVNYLGNIPIVKAS